MKTYKLFTMSLILAAAILSLASCSSKDEKQPEVTQKKAKAKLVKIYTVTKKTMKKSLDLTGTIEAENTANVLSTTDGKITKLLVREGDKVIVNQVVAMVSPNLREDIINTARLNYESAKLKLNEKPDDAELKAQLSEAEENLSFAKEQYKEIPVIAPIAGTISQRYVDLGDMINAKNKIYDIQSNEGFKLEIQVSELDIKKLGVGQKADLFVDACPDKIFSATIARIYPQIDTKTRNGIIELKLLNPCVNIHAGMFARAVFTTRVLKDIIAVPTSSVIERPNKKTCFVIEKNIAKEKEITTGLEEDNFTQIISGISKGEMVVVEGQSSLKTGAKVKIQKKAGGK